MKDTLHFKILATLWGLRNQIITGKADRAARWFAVADRYSNQPDGMARR